MGVPDFMEGSLISYGIGDPKVPKILEIGDPGSAFGGPHFHLTQDLANYSVLQLFPRYSLKCIITHKLA